MHQFCFYLDWAGWSPEVWAAWTQALGSIGAIIAAVLIARHQQRVERREREYQAALEARSMAATTLREVRILKARVAGPLSRLPENVVPNHGYQAYRVAIPQALWDQASRMHVLGEASSPLLSAMYEVQESRELFAADATIYGSDLDQFRDLLQKAAANCDSALEKLKRLLESTPTP